jgi:hypothetical protein
MASHRFSEEALGSTSHNRKRESENQKQQQSLRSASCNAVQHLWLQIQHRALFSSWRRSGSPGLDGVAELDQTKDSNVWVPETYNPLVAFYGLVSVRLWKTSQSKHSTWHRALRRFRRTKLVRIQPR